MAPSLCLPPVDFCLGVSPHPGGKRQKPSPRMGGAGCDGCGYRGQRRGQAARRPADNWPDAGAPRARTAPRRSALLDHGAGPDRSSSRRRVRSPHPGDGAQPLLAAGRLLSGREPHPGGEVPAGLEGPVDRAPRATIAVATTGPTPGMVISRRASGVDLLARRAISTCRARRSARSERVQGRDEHARSTDLAACGNAVSGSSIRSISRATCGTPLAAAWPYSARWPRKALMVWVRWRTSRSRARNTTPLACCSSSFTGVNRMLGRCAASQIASASAASFFCRLTNGLTYAGRDHQPHRVPEPGQLAPPMMRPATRLHRHQAGRLGREKGQHPSSAELLTRKTTAPDASAPCA